MSEFSDIVTSGTPKLKAIGEGKFGAKLATYADGTRGVLKKAPFETGKFRSISLQTMPAREVAAYVLDRDVLGFNLIPETVGVVLDKQDATVQKFVEHSLSPGELVPKVFNRDKRLWKIRMARLFSKLDTDELQRGVIFDLVTNSTDRHGKNVRIELRTHKLWYIDNGGCFGRYYRRYRSVFHKYRFYNQFDISPVILKKLRSIKREALVAALGPYLSWKEVDDTWLRIQFILSHSDKLAWRRFSGGMDIRDRALSNFPDYKLWFARQRAERNPPLVYAP